MEESLWLQNICAKNGLIITAQQKFILEAYVSRLLEWNKNVNLISRRDSENIWSRHILGSIAIKFQYNLKPSATLIDVGTGGGLPGIPLAILNPEIQVVLLDSIQKKVNAVQDILSNLSLPNIRIVLGRAEELSSSIDHKQKFDYVVARAVAPMNDLIEWTKSFLRGYNSSGTDESSNDRRKFISPGRIILLKGGDLEREIREAEIKSKPKCIEIESLQIDGVSPEMLSDKKIVIIQP